uniref:Uncharacterized protein n=1 Tax=Anguilla anguilla TaxID=7936 RepID=A0A0E9RUD3_ANGAN
MKSHLQVLKSSLPQGVIREAKHMAIEELYSDTAQDTSVTKWHLLLSRS